jgi:hypothetical protein
MRHDDRRICPLRIVVRRGVDVGDDVQAGELVGDRMNVDLPRFVLRDGAAIDKGERILRGGAAAVVVLVMARTPKTAPENTSAEAPRNSRLLVLMIS